MDTGYPYLKNSSRIVSSTKFPYSRELLKYFYHLFSQLSNRNHNHTNSVCPTLAIIILFSIRLGIKAQIFLNLFSYWTGNNQHPFGC